MRGAFVPSSLLRRPAGLWHSSMRLQCSQQWQLLSNLQREESLGEAVLWPFVGDSVPRPLISQAHRPGPTGAATTVRALWPLTPSPLWVSLSSLQYLKAHEYLLVRRSYSISRQKALPGGTQWGDVWVAGASVWETVSTPSVRLQGLVSSRGGGLETVGTRKVGCGPGL